jgi:glycosyltransferase involved in cell wall biosynthesis
MKVTILTDKDSSAIGKLANIIKTYSPHMQIRVQALHPKRPSVDQISDSIEALNWCDVLHVAYWKSGDKLKELAPELFTSKFKILTHNNPYDIIKEGRSWIDEYSHVVVNNQTQHSAIPYASLIPLPVDLEKYAYNDNYTDDKTIHMCVARIESKKGVKEVAEVTQKLGYKFILVGLVSDQNYMDEVKKANPNIDFRENISEDELVKSYYESAIHVCNSIDNFESGTMPILEAMSCGVPVLTRNVGHVPDLYNGGNMVVRTGEQTDIEDLTQELQQLMDNKTQRERIREKGWNTARQRPAEKYARQYTNLYHRLYDKPLVSIIVPTLDKPDILTKCLASLVTQTYKNIEILVCDSSTETDITPLIETFKNETNVPIKHIKIEKHGESDYTLPRARNIGVLEAQGEYIMLCDERICPEPTAISEFYNKAGEMTWLYGVKDDYEKGFVENFSFVQRSLLVKYGMFNERIDCYGGASEEIRTRYPRHGVFLESVTKARATSSEKSGNKWNKKNQIIRAKLNIWKLYNQNDQDN